MADLLDLLEKTSRTFALSIPYLPEPTRREVGIAYLLFRIADTFEDATRWPREERIAALEEFAGSLTVPDSDELALRAERWARDVPVEHDGYRELLRETPFVVGEFRRLAADRRESIRRHIGRTATGMSEFVARTDNRGMLRLEDLEDVRRYCYYVAGIVGEMCTELFLAGRPHLRSIRPYLRERAAPFGEGLQLVNILKDSATDVREGRAYLPAGVRRSDVFELAHRDLETAAEYTLALQQAGAEGGIVAFNALPIRLAWATLARVEAEGPGSKISRPELWEIVESVERALKQGRPAVEPPSTSPAGR